jgi:outer membrane protein assembly factor BamB
MKLLSALTMLLLTTPLAKAQMEVDPSSAMFRFQNKELAHSSHPKFRPVGEVKWKFKTNGKVFSSPAVLHGTAVIGSADNNLYAIIIKTGKQNWKFTTAGAIHSSPAVVDNTVYVGSMDGYFYAVDFISGKQKWKFKTGGEKPIGDTAYWGMKPADMFMEDLWDSFLSSPIVSKNREGLTVYFGSSDSYLYALDGNSGMVKWKFKTSGSIHSSPTLYQGTIYIGGWDTYMYAIDAKTGSEKWKFKTGEQPAMAGIQSSPTVADGVVYFGARDAHLYALDANRGNLLWKYDAHGSWIISSAVVRAGVVYAGTSDSYLLLALDAKTGREIFKFKTRGYVFGTPAVLDGTAYFGDFTGTLYALALASKGKQWNSFSTEGRKLNAPSVLKMDTLDFMYAAKGNDLSFYPANKKVMDEFYSLGSIVSSPTVKDGVIYFGSADGYLYALGLKN